MLEVLRGAECRDLAHDYINPESEPNIERFKAELKEAALEQYGQAEWDHWIEVALRERGINSFGEHPHDSGWYEEN